MIGFQEKMSSDWFAYKTKTGAPLFFYNSKTFEHRWANNCSLLQFQFIKKEIEDHSGNCTSSDDKSEDNASHWHPYTLKSGDVLFYYNVVTGEHKWDLSSDTSNSSIPSEPVIPKDGMENDCNGDCRNVDLNINAIDGLPSGNIEVKKESDRMNNEDTQCIEQTDALQQNSSTDQPEEQFLVEINSTEPGSSLMTLRSTMKRRIIGSNEVSLQEEHNDSEEYFSDSSLTSSNDDCSNFSDELPEISSNESEEEEERTRASNQSSTCDFQSSSFLQNIPVFPESNQGKNKIIILQNNTTYPSNKSLNHEGQPYDLQDSSLRQDISTSAHANIQGINEIKSNYEKASVNNGVLLHRLAQREVLSPFRSTNHDGMPKIGGIFSISESDHQQLANLKFEKSQKSIDSTILSIYQPETEIRYENNDVWRRISPTLQSSNDSLVVVNENKELEDPEAIINVQKITQPDQIDDNSTACIVEAAVTNNKVSISPECCSKITPVLSGEKHSSPSIVKYRYHYSIKCLLPIISSFPEQTETLQTSCDNRSPTMILSSQYVSVVSAGNGEKSPMVSLTPGKTNSPRITLSDAKEQKQLRTTSTASLIRQIQPEPSLLSRNERPGLASLANDHGSLSNFIDSSPSKAKDHYSDARMFNGIPLFLGNLCPRYKCCYCVKDFPFREELQRHIALRHLLFGGVFLCNSCDDSFNSQEEFTKHLLLHDEVNPVTCRHCKTEFFTVEDLACHISVHVDEPKYPKYKKAVKVDSKSENTDQDVTECLDNSEDKLEKRRQCNYCDKNFKHYFSFRLHLKTHSEVNDHTCLLCGKSYLDLKSLRKHVVIHLREKHLECKICHKTFRFHSDYLQHQLVHVPGQLFRCEKRGCKEVFNTWVELRKHEIDIHEEKRYRCMTCGKSFSRPEKLQLHLRLHTGEKPLECSKCGKRFRTRIILRNHEKIHLEFKTFKCAVCGKGFKQKCSMLRHSKTHIEGPKEYPCNLCKKRFTQSCSLQRHLRVHSGERFKCSKCSMKFLEAWRMRIHIKNKHL